MLFIKNEFGQIIKLHGIVKVFDDSDSFTWSAKFPSSCLKQMISDFQKNHTTNSFELNKGNSPITPESKL
jgi:hypothetical protein